MGFANSDGPGPSVAVTDGAGDQGGAPLSNGTDCEEQLLVTVRDFTEMHPDFESFDGQVDGLVAFELGMDNTPTYAHAAGTSVTTGPTEFSQWYHDVAGVNMRIPGVGIDFVETSPGVFLFESDAFFPIDGQGFGNGPLSPVPGLPIPIFEDHNYLFTTEVHTQFTYAGGEQFTFTGDDDLWIFVNRRLAIDIGGVHGSRPETLDMDARAAELGIELGQTYSMDIFHAERHTDGSNFRIETTIDFSCIVNIPPLE